MVDETTSHDRILAKIGAGGLGETILDFRFSILDLVGSLYY